MFTIARRDHVRQYILDRAQADPRITGGALIGSTASGAQDARSDIDVTFGVAASHDPEMVLADWTQILGQEFGVLHHFDLRAGASIYRVFLLPDGLEIDFSVTPEGEFGARGPHFQLLFGDARRLQAAPAPDIGHIIGLCWHHVFHARSCIERTKLWQAEYWIGEIRDHTLTLLCLRLDQSAVHRRGVDTLPTALTDPFKQTLVRSLDKTELRRALAVATILLIAEIEKHDQALCARLKPLLHEFGGCE